MFLQINFFIPKIVKERMEYLSEEKQREKQKAYEKYVKKITPVQIYAILSK